MIHKVNSAISKQTICGLDLTMIDPDNPDKKMEIATELAFDLAQADYLYAKLVCPDCDEDE